MFLFILNNLFQSTFYMDFAYSYVIAFVFCNIIGWTLLFQKKSSSFHRVSLEFIFQFIFWMSLLKPDFMS